MTLKLKPHLNTKHTWRTTKKTQPRSITIDHTNRFPTQTTYQLTYLYQLTPIVSRPLFFATSDLHSNLWFSEHAIDRIRLLKALHRPSARTAPRDRAEIAHRLHRLRTEIRRDMRSRSRQPSTQTKLPSLAIHSLPTLERKSRNKQPQSEPKTTPNRSASDPIILLLLPNLLRSSPDHHFSPRVTHAAIFGSESMQSTGIDF